MGDIKRQINSITDLKRGATNVNFVYRGTALVWQRGTPTPRTWTIDTWVLEGLGFYKDINPITTWTIDQGTGFTQKL